MKTIHVSEITEAVRKLCIKANYTLPEDIERELRQSLSSEPWQPAKEILTDILENIRVSGKEKLPLCQDTGMACVFMELGQNVHIDGISLYEAVNEGVRRGCADGFLRASVVSDPLRRVNTGDNSPAFITCDIVDGDSLKITVCPKGIGAENMSRLKMLPPSCGIDGVIDFVLETVRQADSNPCPPLVVGVGIGGTFDKSALLAKRALLRPVDSPNPDPFYQKLEEDLLEEINRLGIGPQGFGGKATAIGVNIEAYPTHIAGLPVAVNISCHVTRHASLTL